MELSGTYFFDTYAFCEMLKGNENYKKYAKDIKIATSKLNLMELYYGTLNEKGKEIADRVFEKFREFCIDFDDDAIKEAMAFRLKEKKKNLSYVDCIGYIMAKRRGIKFLTGDIQFENMPDVEYVK